MINQEVASLNPSTLWTSFEQLNAVPRPSKKEERVIAFMQEFGKKLGLETITDGVGNVIIKKPATKGMEDRKGVVLQAHLDMVHQKNSDSGFDFDTQGIESYIDGDWVKAKGTTLGADNGIGVAAAMAVLKSKDIEHGPVEALFTIDEETGMTGAAGLEQGILEGHILLNMDTEDEGELCIGCAGGIDTNISLAYGEEEISSGKAFLLTVKGLKGGHSGCEIHLGRANANKLMNRILWQGYQNFGLRISSIDGGGLRNAIPRESFAVVVVPADSVEAFTKHVEEVFESAKTEFAQTEPVLSILCEETAHPHKVMNIESQVDIISSIENAPNGVGEMSKDFEGLVESSTSLARIVIKDEQFKAQFLTRSSVDESKMAITKQIDETFKETGANIEHTGEYPGWTPNPSSEILTIMEGLHQDFFRKDAIVNAVHAGLECGIIGERYPQLDMISFGPTIKNPHSPDEKCEINTVARFWEFLLLTLKSVPVK